jgi:N,N-dimethylformamidase beta subunit-like protein
MNVRLKRAVAGARGESRSLLPLQDRNQSMGDNDTPMNWKGFTAYRWAELPRMVVSCFALFLLLFAAPSLFAQTNAIVLENQLEGNPPSEWDIVGGGDPSIQGFATEISVNKGDTIRFKIDTPATNYVIYIFRMGYYNGDGARFITNVSPSVSLPQIQPDPVVDLTTGLIDCGNWAETASWQVPTNAVSGIYIARPTRLDTSGASHIIFVVRDDDGGSDILFQTSDQTWAAYNTYGGNSLYDGGGPGGGSAIGRAYKVSYNRPLINRGSSFWASLFTAEYPMVRWLERNGYNISYTTGIDTDRHGNLLTNQHKVFLSVGNEE